MKTTVKQLATATFIALFLIATNVRAEGTEAKGAKSESIETKLQLESWMTDETIWNPNSAIYAELVQETETALQLEGWMTKVETWNLNNSFVDETEAGLELENWMVNESIWK